MANRMHEQIMDTLATKLAAISTGSGYDITVATVEQSAKDTVEVPSSLYPWIGIVYSRTDYEHKATGFLDGTMTINLLSHVSGTTSAILTNKLSDLENSIRKAIYDDSVLGLEGMIYTRVVSKETNESDPGSLEPGERAGTMLMVIECKYTVEQVEA